MNRSSWPTIQDLDALGTTLSLVAPPEFEDGNGHVNVSRYYGLHMDASNDFFSDLGFGDDYRDHTGHSVFSVEQHILFHDETLVGDDCSVHMRLLGLGPKAIHGQSIIVNRSRGTIANTMEFFELHVDLTTRRATEFRQDFYDLLDVILQKHQSLPWSLPLSGSMGVR